MSNNWYYLNMKIYHNEYKKILESIQDNFSVKVSFVNNQFLKKITKTNFPVQGLFNEKEILLLDVMDQEKSLFTLIHIAGHYIQWKNDPQEKEYSFFFQENSEQIKTSSEIKKHHLHEIDSINYSLEFLNRNNIHHLDDWFKKSFEKDQEYINNLFTKRSLKETIGIFNQKFIYVI
jgi:hypothetical protein